MPSSPQVSILVPTYNRCRLLLDALTSILKQSYTDFEVIVVDNCSPDGTEAAMRSLRDERIVYVRNEVNVGPVNNHNRALRLARGKYVYFFSDDDVMLEHNLARKVEVFEKYPSVGVVHCSINTIDGEGNTISTGHWALGDLQQAMTSQPLMPQATAFELLYNRWNFLAMPTVVVRREVLQQNRLEMNNQLKYLYDWDLWLKLALKTDFYYLDEVLVLYRAHATNDSNSFTPKVLFKEMTLSKLGMLNLFNQDATLHGWDYLAEVGKLVKKQLKAVNRYESHWHVKSQPVRSFLIKNFSGTTVELLRKIRYGKLFSSS
jgi:glycosyltransferase involved in cell wall biosynthesis